MVGNLGTLGTPLNRTCLIQFLKERDFHTGREDPRSRLNSETRVEGSGQLEGLLVGETAVVNKSLSSWEGHFVRTKFRVILIFSPHAAHE